MQRLGVLNKYKEYLPLTEKTPLITLYEGETPLFFAKNLSRELEINLYFKYEGMNPTGSFKDRGMVLAVAKALEAGSKAIICASTGNTSASAAAYAAHANIRSIVVVPNQHIAMGKLAQAVMFGAEVIAIDGNFDEALQIVREIAEENNITLVNSVNPYRLEGQKTAAFEICDWLNTAPDYLAIPVGNAGNISAYWKGFKEYYSNGKITKLPQMLGFEAEGAAALVKGFPIDNPETIATAIRIGKPASWEKAVNAVTESGGWFNAVTDEEIIAAYKLLAKEEGIFAEPASAASLAGLIKELKLGKIKTNSTVVSVLTGNGLKDPQTALNVVETKPLVLPKEKERIVEILNLT